MPIAAKRSAETSPHARVEAFAEDVLKGLSQPQKTLPCRYLYDARGSELFEAITRLPEYYPTRTERGILETHAGEIAALIPDGGILVEFGSGSSLKTEILLDALPRIAAYVAIDVSPTALAEARDRLSQRFPALDVRTIEGNFSHPVPIPPDIAGCPRTGFFPGSTIGNQGPQEAVALLGTIRRCLGQSHQLIVGVDLKKDVRTLVAAYDDSAGTTAAFNLNLLTRINRELRADFDTALFEHVALYDPRPGRIEMHLRSVADQVVTIHGRRVRFAAGETIHTESSYKYTIEEFQQLAGRAGWVSARVWTDQALMFSVHALS